MHVDASRRTRRLQRVVHSRSVDVGTATVRRFLGIDGFTHAGLLSIELFTTVIPLIIIGFSYRNDFSTDANVGDRFIALLGLSVEEADRFAGLFGSAAGIRSTWSVFGVAGFLVWGIPMAITVAAMYARAWQRPSFSLWGKLWRGGIWFIVYLGSQSARSRVMAVGYDGLAAGVPRTVRRRLPLAVLVADAGARWCATGRATCARCSSPGSPG